MAKKITPDELSNMILFIESFSIHCTFQDVNNKSKSSKSKSKSKSKLESKSKSNVKAKKSRHHKDAKKISSKIFEMPTTFTPVPSAASTILNQESKRHRRRSSNSYSVGKTTRKSRGARRMTSLGACNSVSRRLSETASRAASRTASRSGKTRSSTASRSGARRRHRSRGSTAGLTTRPSDANLCRSSSDDYSSIDTSILRTTLPVQLFFMQKRIGSIEIANDATLRSMLVFALDRITDRITNEFSFYVYGSVYDVNWKRPKQSVMKSPAPENLFRVMFTPKMVDLTLQEINKQMSIDEMGKLNVYIFIKELNDEVPDEFQLQVRTGEEETLHWHFSHVY